MLWYIKADFIILVKYIKYSCQTLYLDVLSDINQTDFKHGYLYIRF